MSHYKSHYKVPYCTTSTDLHNKHRQTLISSDFQFESFWNGSFSREAIAENRNRVYN
jgi:hypothetical protein